MAKTLINNRENIIKPTLRNTIIKQKKDKQNLQNKIIVKQLMQKKFQRLRVKLIGTKVQEKFQLK